MAHVQTITRTVPDGTFNISFLASTLSPVRAMKAYNSLPQIKRHDATGLADVGMTAAERDVVTFVEVFATA